MLCIGIGGGGDVVGALGVAQAAAEAGLEAHVGGVTWERRPVDPLAGPRRMGEVEGATIIGPGAALAGPDTTGPGGFRFAESHMARVLGAPTVLIDLNDGPVATAAALDAAAAHLGCDLVALVDVGGDVLGHGDEPNLASPLCDAVLLAASSYMATPAIGAVFGPACDGELSPAEVLERMAELASAGGWLGTWGLTPAATELLERAVEQVPTEASAQALLAARGGMGPSPIREGRRNVELSPVCALTFFFDCAAAIAGPARCAAAVLDAGSLTEADDRLTALGIRTELAWEAARAAERP